MNFKPILFSTSMVKAIADESKTQTRRVIKPQPDFDSAWKNWGESENVPRIDVTKYFLGIEDNHPDEGFYGTAYCVPNIRVKVHKGDIFWVRETWQHTKCLNLNWQDENYGYVYRADDQPWEDFEGWTWKPSIFMPKEACRIFLKVTNVHVERLHDISEDDAKAEGAFDMNCGIHGITDHKNGFFHLWESINGKESLESNPWVWVYDFERTEKPDNFL